MLHLLFSSQHRAEEWMMPAIGRAGAKVSEFDFQKVLFEALLRSSYK